MTFDCFHKSLIVSKGIQSVHLYKLKKQLKWMNCKKTLKTKEKKNSFTIIKDALNILTFNWIYEMRIWWEPDFLTRKNSEPRELVSRDWNWFVQHHEARILLISRIIFLVLLSQILEINQLLTIFKVK